MKRVAIVSPATAVGDMSITGSRIYQAFFEELVRVGYIEGQNLVVERYSGGGRTERYAGLVRDVVSTSPDLIFPVSTVLALGFKMATSMIPIVAITGDPVTGGLVKSLARPGGNITGVTVDAGSALHGKRVEFLVEATPKSSNARLLGSQSSWDGTGGAAIREAARQLGISFAIARLDEEITEAAYQRAFHAMERDRVDALVVADQPEHFTYRRLLVELAAKYRIPTIYPFREHVELGGLMSYSADLLDIYRRVANQIAEVLKGKNTAEIPFYQPTKFELIINLRTANALDLTVPPALLARADEVID
ncbi:MAG: ABC transporter substrate-binding protein [Rhodopseudomonas sp.]|uniref:ABC transporter substrate-binding protein n=1 Tax=Rhodopseudomonas sp. TaxID=1078 RepID=UPI0017B18B99|nr:ABC transporter substrate-binding protein [Rhodopseudomonas sp.]NVN88716.1 ABC transporter substrate-binding protein [Rhodopseudomonas sp.]